MDTVVSLKKIDLFCFVLLTMMISGASSIASNDFFRLFLLIIMLLYAQRKRKPLLNQPLFLLLGGWITINFIASLHLQEEVAIYPFIGKIVLIYLIYLFLICIGKDFWEKYEHFLYKMVLIAFIPYFILQIAPSLFDQIAPFFKPFTADTFHLKSSQKNYFYSFFFVYNNGVEPLRNNGFMWEPGAYAMLLTILISYNFASKGVKFNKHVTVYVLALLTTFSTAGYIAFSILAFLFFLKKKNSFTQFIIIITGSIILYWIIDADFLLPKIEESIASTEKNELYHQGYRELYEANRLLSLSLLYDKFLLYPFGWGVVEDNVSYLAKNKIVTVNGLGNVLVTWGIFFFLWLIYSIATLYQKYSHSLQLTLLVVVALCIMFFSNPIENNALLYLLALSPSVLFISSRTKV